MIRFIFLVLSIFLCILAYSQPPSNALHFVNNDYVQTSYPGVRNRNARTIEAWIKPDSLKRQSVICDWGTLSLGKHFAFAVNKGVLEVDVQGASAYGTTEITDSIWHHVAVVFNPSDSFNLKFYVDGKLDTAYKNFGPVGTTVDKNMLIGMRIDGKRAYKGLIDELRVWNQAQTQRQLDSLKDLEICGNMSGLKAYYRFNHGEADSTNAVDSFLYNAVNRNYANLKNFSLTGSKSNWVKGKTLTQAPDTDTTFSVTACGRYKSPSGAFYTRSQTVRDTLSNSFGCDSFMTIKLTILDTSRITTQLYVCDSMTSPSGRHTWTETGVYIDTLVKGNGCDSLLEYVLFVYKSTIETVDVEACYKYLSWTTSGLYRDTLSTSRGCDSILIYNLTIHDTINEHIYVDTCTAYRSKQGNVYTKSGLYKERYQAASGCDSIVNLHLSIHQGKDTSINLMGCDSVVSPSGANTWTLSGDYVETHTTSEGCDSIVNFKVTIYQASIENLDSTSCGPYTSPSGKLWTVSGSYSDTILGQLGCDSILNIDLQIIENSPTITQTRDSLFVDQMADGYQWLNCDLNYATISGANSAYFIPSETGNYAVEIMVNGCRDTSQCINFRISVGINEGQISAFKWFPNPVDHLLHLRDIDGPFEYFLTDQKGRLIRQGIGKDYSIIDIKSLPNGLYVMMVSTSSGMTVETVVVIHD
jgi:Concanavalin A-like lectin/glucanases superfamily